MLEAKLNIDNTYVRVDGVDTQKWQKLVDMLAELFNAASADIVEYKGDHFNVLTTSDNDENFLEPGSGWSWNTKTFCKYIVEKKQSIYVRDAQNDQHWKDAPFVVAGSVCSYFGEPILWPNGDVFGSFCVIDNKPTNYSNKLKKVLSQLKYIIESDLQHCCTMQELALVTAEKNSSLQQVVHEKEKRDEVQHQLYSQEAIVSATLNVLVDAVIRIDERGTILAINSQTELMFGFCEKELIGQNVNCLMPKAYKENHDSYISNHLHSGIKKIIGTGRDVEAQRKDGSIFPIRLSVSKIEIEGGIQFIGLIEDITEKVEYENKLREFALYDSLTKCANRNLLAQRFEFFIASAKRNNKEFTIGYIDLNKFKPLNDTYGHKCGDDVLVEVGKRLRGYIRDTDLVARVGGDEFVILFADPVTEPRASQMLKDCIELPIQYNSQELHISASVGFSTYPEDGTSMDALLEKADKRMYLNKDDN